MQRRSFITLLGGAVAAWPLTARAQQAAMPVIGVLGVGSLEPNANSLAELYKGLNEAGYIAGQNVAIEYRWAEDQYDRLPALAAELVRRQVAVIVTTSANAVQAGKEATATIPIVFTIGSDPVRLGLIASLNRPGGNVTGVSRFSSELNSKRLELLRELVPAATTIALLTNPTNLQTEPDTTDVLAAARSVGQQIIVVRASTVSEIDAAFAMVAEQRAGALLVNGDIFFRTRRVQLSLLAARYRIPASYTTREFVAAGGLMSYGDDRAESNRQAGLYVGRILKGAKPADLPVLQPTKFDFIINLTTAKVLDLTFPPSFHLRATELIE